ncbi:hypothetical protein QTG54_012967 [Skeletonema marinoi]|uniref:Uncharacterized protein n=1 Tax=Skeletonema marinoi TaxID=267567 RepID=A0AAD8XZ40_9STRA|nr:hypothetical protein QTG54_012967 [Skeletonema marinoi]
MGYRNNKSSRSEQIVEEEKKDEKSETDHEAASLHFSAEHLDKKKRGNTEPEQDNNQDGDHLLAPTLPTAAFQMQQHLQASLAHQQFLEQAAEVAAVQQHLTPTLNSLQLNNGISNDHHLQHNRRIWGWRRQRWQQRCFRPIFIINYLHHNLLQRV